MARRPTGWAFAQLRTSFASDPEFQRLARRAPDDLHYLAAIGLWTLGLAQAWREDDQDVTDLLESFDGPAAELLATAKLVSAKGELRGFEKHTAEVRATREADAERKRKVRDRPPESTGVTRSPPGVGYRRGEDSDSTVDSGRSSEGTRARPRPANVTGFATAGKILGSEE